MTSETWTATRCAQEWGIGVSTWTGYVATGRAPEPLPGYDDHRRRRWLPQAVRDYPRPGQGSRTDLATRRGTAAYDKTAGTITVTTGDEVTVIAYDRPPGYVPHALTEHGWSMDCPEATTPHLTLADDGTERAAVVSHPMPDGWEETLRGWVELHGDHQVTVRGTRSAIRYLIIRPGDALEGDALQLEMPDPNSMLFERARRSMDKARQRAAAAGQPYRLTFAELLNPGLIEVPELRGDLLDEL